MSQLERINVIDREGIKGIDVSKWQGDVDWERVKADGIHFAMLRMGLGNKNGSGYRIDEWFERYVAGATAAGLDIGCYFYSYASTPAEAKNEARYVVGTLAAYQGTFTYPIVLDLEYQPLESLDKDTLTSIVLEFGNYVERAGYYFALYSNLNWITYHYNMNDLACFDLWLAEWKDRPTYTGSYGMWQCGTSYVDGIQGDVDTDYAYKEYSTIIRSAGLNGFTISPVELNPDLISRTAVLDEFKRTYCHRCGALRRNQCERCMVSGCSSIISRM